MPKNNRQKIKSISTMERCVECCMCGLKIEYIGSDNSSRGDKGKLLMRLHNKVCRQQVVGQYDVEVVNYQRPIVFAR
jgi:hypothetical protein